MISRGCLVTRAFQFTSKLTAASATGAWYSTCGWRSSAQLRNLRTLSKAEGHLGYLGGGARGISYGGLVKAFQGQLVRRHEKSSGVGLYSNDGKINPPPGKIRFGFVKVLLVVSGGMMLGAYIATHLSIMLENFEHFSQEVDEEEY